MTNYFIAYTFRTASGNLSRRTTCSGYKDSEAAAITAVAASMTEFVRLNLVSISATPLEFDSYSRATGMHRVFTEVR